MMVWISVESVVISPLSFFIASIWLFSLSFLINLANGLFCWSFQKSSSWIYWFFWRVFCVSISFNSALILVISCLLLGFEFFWSCSSSSFNFDDMVSILDLSTLLMWVLIAIYFPLETALNVSQRFWYVVSSFSMEYYAAIKEGWVHVLCRHMDEAGNHHSQQTDTRTENQTVHVLTHKWVLNNENTWRQGGDHHTVGRVGDWEWGEGGH